MVVCTTSTLTRRSSRTVPQAGFTAYGQWFGFLTLSEPSALATTRSPAHRRATAVGTFARWDSSSICTTPSASCFPGRHRRSGLGWSIGSRERGNRDDPWPHGGLQRMLKGPSSEAEATTASRRKRSFRTAPHRGIGEASADGTAVSLRYFCLAYHQDSAPSFRLSTSSAEKLEAFSGGRQAIGQRSGAHRRSVVIGSANRRSTTGAVANWILPGGWRRFIVNLE